MVVDNGVVNLRSGEQVVVVGIEWADFIPEGLATARLCLGVRDQARLVGITLGHDVGGVSGPVVAHERLSVLNSGRFLSGTSLSLEEAEEVAFGLGDGYESDDDEGCDFLEHIYLLIFIYYKFL